MAGGEPRRRELHPHGGSRGHGAPPHRPPGREELPRHRGLLARAHRPRLPARLRARGRPRARGAPPSARRQAPFPGHLRAEERAHRLHHRPSAHVGRLAERLCHRRVPRGVPGGVLQLPRGASARRPQGVPDARRLRRRTRAPLPRAHLAAGAAVPRGNQPERLRHGVEGRRRGGAHRKPHGVYRRAHLQLEAPARHGGALRVDHRDRRDVMAVRACVRRGSRANRLVVAAPEPLRGTSARRLCPDGRAGPGEPAEPGGIAQSDDPPEGRVGGLQGDGRGHRVQPCGASGRPRSSGRSLRCGKDHAFAHGRGPAGRPCRYVHVPGASHHGIPGVAPGGGDVRSPERPARDGVCP